MLGIVPIIDSIENKSTETEIKYQVKVNLLNLRTNQAMGCGFAICSNKETSKKFFDEYAIMSMAQTRAIGKAYRNTLSWIIKAAGYESLPFEEADSMTPDNSVNEQPSAVVVVEEKEDAELVTLRTDLIRKIDNPVITNSERAYIVEKIPDFNKDAIKKWIVKFDKLIINRAKETEAV